MRASGLSAEEVEVLAQQAHRNNNALGVRGAYDCIVHCIVVKEYCAVVAGILVYVSGIFFHVLEGMASLVQALYLKISMDPRHCNCFIIGVLFAECRALCCDEATEIEKNVSEALYSTFNFRKVDSSPEVRHAFRFSNPGATVKIGTIRCLEY